MTRGRGVAAASLMTVSVPRSEPPKRFAAMAGKRKET